MNKTVKLLNNFVFVNKLINRPLAALAVKALLPTKVTPNQVTVISFFLGILGAVFFSLGKPVYFVWGGILVQLSSMVDCLDGMLARAKDECSAYGAYLDIFLDRVNEFFIIVGYSFGLYRASADFALFVLALVASSLYFLHILLYYITKKLVGDDSTGGTDEMRALLLFFVCVFGLINRLDWGIYVFITSTVLVNLYLIANFIFLGKKQKKTVMS